MDRRHRTVPKRPPQWLPLVSPAQWHAVASALDDTPGLLDDVQVILAQLSPSVRGVLIANLMIALEEPEARPTRAVWAALAVTGHEIQICSAITLGRLDALGEDALRADVRSITPPE